MACQTKLNKWARCVSKPNKKGLSAMSASKFRGKPSPTRGKAPDCTDGQSRGFKTSSRSA